MHLHKKQKLLWMSVGAVLGFALGSLVTSCCATKPEMQLPPHVTCDGGADVASPPIVVPVDAGSDSGVYADAGCDAARVDAGPSCGTHPWCKRAKECCTEVFDCCA
jgi:hypothetical protein